MNSRILLISIIPIFCFGIRDFDTHDINNCIPSEINYARDEYKKFYFNSLKTILETEKILPPRRPIITLQVYPNPIRHNSKISFSLAQSGPVSIKLYNTTGRLVQEIFNGYKPAGNYKINLDIKGLAQGTYFLRIETPIGTLSRSLIILQ
jgi:hypothetical protein